LVDRSANYSFIKGSICDYNLVAYLIKEHQIDHVIHFAAQSHVDQSFLEPLKYTRDNVVGTHTLLEAVRLSGRLDEIVFLHISTDEVYGESVESDCKTETHILSPTNPYAATKAAAEMLVNAYKHSFGLKAIITRSNNVYGPNQYPEKLIPKFIQLLKKGKPVTIHGDGSSRRSFIYVGDLVQTFELILQKGKIGEIYNIGSTEEYTVKEIAERLIHLIYPNDSVDKWTVRVPDRPFNDCRYFIDDQKVRGLGYVPMFKDFNKNLRMLIEEDSDKARQKWSVKEVSEL
jgi:dTDP-glucose 4,6-dehydratase